MTRPDSRRFWRSQEIGGSFWIIEPPAAVSEIRVIRTMLTSGAIDNAEVRTVIYFLYWRGEHILEVSRSPKLIEEGSLDCFVTRKQWVKPTEVSRASQTQYAPHIGLPQREPVARQMKVKAARFLKHIKNVGSDGVRERST